MPRVEPRRDRASRTASSWLRKNQPRARESSAASTTTQPRRDSTSVQAAGGAADGAAELEAVHLGQHHVKDRSVKAALTRALQQRQAFAGPQRLHQFQLETLEVGGQRGPQLFVVVDEQDAVHGVDSHPGRCGALAWARWRRIMRRRRWSVAV